MFGELVTTQTSDHVRLDGLLTVANEQWNPTFDVAIVVHGLSGNFYKSKLLQHFARALLEGGVSSLLVNTRGHDYLNVTPQRGRAATFGAAVEIVDQCRFDLFAWAEFCVKRDFQRILLLGHSLGAIKSLYAQAHMPHPNVQGIAAFSATRLSYDSLISSSGRERFEYWLTTATTAVDDGRGDDLLFVDFPFPTWMSAQAYLKKYDDGDRYNWLSFVSKIVVPTLAVFGERELDENPAFQVMRRDLSNLQQANLRLDYIPAADHFYSACFAPATRSLLDWIDVLTTNRPANGETTR